MKTHLDLCSGIGGFALAAGWNGYTTIGFCEIDPFCTKVLQHHFPGVPIHDDLKTLSGDDVRGWLGRNVAVSDVDDSKGIGRSDGYDGTDSWPTPGNVNASSVAGDSDGARLDLLTAGYPCQPFSHAGKRLGAEDDRHLWPFIAGLVDDLRPRWCVFENVGGHVSMGLDDVLSDLEAIGYTSGATVVPAAAVGAPHRRDRVWILASDARGGVQPGETECRSFASESVAHANSDERRSSGHQDHQTGRFDPTVGGGPQRSFDVLADSESCAAGPRWSGCTRGTVTDRGHSVESRRETLCRVGEQTHGLPRRLAERVHLDERWDGDPLNAFGPDWEDGVPRVIDHEAQRVSKLKALGNAIVPQCAYVIIAAISEAMNDSAT